jgi:hypothetical protein
MNYKTFKEFYWKHALLKIGIPWGFLAGILFAIVQDKTILRYFTSLEILIQILFFVLGGFLLALTLGKSLWNRSKKAEGEN